MEAADGSVVSTAFVLCGGLGTRLRPAVGSAPKSMATVGDRPFLAYLIDQIERAGIERVVLLTGYGAADLERYFGTGAPGGVEIRYSREASPLGTGGAVRLGLSQADDERFLLLNGDSYLGIDLRALAREHDPRRHAVTVALTAVTDAARFGRVTVAEDGAIIRFAEKEPVSPSPELDLVNAGIYVMERSWAERIPPQSVVSLERDVLMTAEPGTLRGVVFDAPFIDIGLPRTLAQARREPGILASDRAPTC